SRQPPRPLGQPHDRSRYTLSNNHFTIAPVAPFDKARDPSALVSVYNGHIGLCWYPEVSECGVGAGQSPGATSAPVPRKATRTVPPGSTAKPKGRRAAAR